ncbi:hypothetical protein [Hyphomicrobium sp. DY-1]|uniref:hypothetical protein n=1 Tax=Hyphomicrobium sp. DY-1 TaxID=3075650 RepID=UPI0039C0445B
MQPTVWTPARLRIIKGLVRDGALVCTHSQAAVLCGVSRASITTYCMLHDIKAKWPNIWTPEHQKAISAFVVDGKFTEPLGTIARALNIPVTVLAGQAARQGIATKNNAGDVKRRTIEGVLQLSSAGFLNVPERVAAARIGNSVYAVEDAMKILSLRPMKDDLKRKAAETFWTRSRIQGLKACISTDGRLTMSKANAAKELDCSPPMVHRYVIATGVAATRRTIFTWTAPRKTALRRLCTKGILTVPVPTAAKRFGCSVGQIREGLARIGAIPTPKSPWTPARLRKLKGFLNGHGRLSMTIKDACAALACDRKSLRLGLVLLTNPGYVRFEWTPARVAHLRSFCHNGVLRRPLPEVMMRLGCSEKVLRRAMQVLNLSARPRFSWTPEADARLAKLMRPDGTLSVTYDQAANIIGCSPRSIDTRMTRDRKETRLRVARRG